MINNLSNRSFAWLAGTLIMSIVIIAMIMQHMKEINNALGYAQWGFYALAILAVLYGLYRLWHAEHLRTMDRKERKYEVAERRARVEKLESEKWSIEQDTLTKLSEQDREHEFKMRRLELDHMRALELERMKYQFQVLGANQSYVIREQDGSITHIASPHIAGEIAASSAAAKQGNVIEARYPEPIDFAQVLQSFSPSRDAIYLLHTVDDPVLVPMGKVCHVGIGGPTGGGKTNITRMITSQILACGGVVYMANPNYNPVKLNGAHIEDWRPIVRKLQDPVARDIADINKLLDKFIKVFEKRKKEADHSIRRGVDIFLIVCELPAIIAQNKEAADPIGRLLREARQYGIHVISEFQDALVSTIGGNSGVRENYRTGYYSGGDQKTAQILLDLGKGERVEEEGIGQKGAVYLRCESTRARAGRVPFFSNRAMYDLLGYPPDPMTDQLISDESQIPETFYTLSDDGRYIPSASQAHSIVIESTIETRSDSRETPSEIAAIADYQTRSTGPLNELVDESDVTTEESYPRLDDIKVAQFHAIYKVRQNIDFCLRQIGVGTAYRAHARAIIQAMKEQES